MDEYNAILDEIKALTQEYFDLPENVAKRKKYVEQMHDIFIKYNPDYNEAEVLRQVGERKQLLRNISYEPVK